LLPCLAAGLMAATCQRSRMTARPQRPQPVLLTLPGTGSRRRAAHVPPAGRAPALQRPLAPVPPLYTTAGRSCTISSSLALPKSASSK
jgi:hypothetical protein